MVCTDGNYDSSGSNAPSAGDYPSTGWPKEGHERWRNACFYKYCEKVDCPVSVCGTCTYLHDLTEAEEALFVAWQAQGRHVLFPSTSTAFGSTPGFDVNGIASQTDPDYPSTRATGSFESAQDRSAGESTQDRSRDSTKDRSETVLLEEEEDGAAHEGLPSRGSALHQEGNCKPCVFFGSEDGCPTGADCRFCHEKHSGREMRKSKLRSCKSKRDRYRKLVARITEKIEDDPEAFDATELALPPSISGNSFLRKKLVARMESHAEQMRTERRGDATTQEEDEGGTVDVQPSSSMPES